MVNREHWRFRPSWLEWVNATWIPDRGRVQQQYTGGEVFAEFSHRATRAFKDKGVVVARLKVWVAVQEPEDGSGYSHGYPHVHYPLDATTLVHYLDPGDAATPFDVFDGDRVVESITPEQGLTVMFRNDVRHGVKKNAGKTARRFLIATALPRR